MRGNNSEDSCVIGGEHANWPANGHVILGSTHYYIEGNDTSFTPFKKCCGEHKVNLIEPCLMWCETDGNLKIWACWLQNGFKPDSAFGTLYGGGTGLSGPSTQGGLSTAATAGISVDAVAVVVLLCGLLFCWLRARRLGARDASKARHHSRLLLLGIAFSYHLTALYI
ncbi:hypothetical protein Micbo1qcDRAFT_207381 [Microdochium bolleyi]|uniref:Uncharacterized protein n=1 Tax=Microdochium bolleyi TaxID=196109 RepID=A0A136ITK6_9PEZI|nr:hypothetical protein Micbo1qcDRAFT_207381 [Microdochium bolleyi]